MDISPNNPAVSAAYVSARKKWYRPQAMLWSDYPGIKQGNVVFPSQGTEKEDFIILSDHNRKEINISQKRVENRQRMINGTMRSYFTADKATISVSWERLPSRSYSRNVTFDKAGQTGKPNMLTGDVEHTVDGGAGGAELLEWYENHSGPFYVFLAYDKYTNFTAAGAVTDASFDNLYIYNDIKLMYFASFDYTIEKRGSGNFDFWNVTLSLEEA